MTDPTPRRTWTLRRTQIAAIVVITVLFLARVFLPPLGNQARAEKLYLDAWFTDVHLDPPSDRDADSKGSVTMLKGALELSPGNSLYEQALVWRCPEKGLKNLIENGNLGEKALILASHRYYTYLDKQADSDEWKRSSKKPKKPSIYSVSDMYYFPPLHLPDYWSKKLDRLNKLAVVDPENALIKYRRAYIYGSVGRQSDMLDEVRKANAMDLCAIRMPEVLPAIQNTLADPRLYGFFGDSSQLRELARQMVGYSNEQLRARNVPAALAASEDACQMGVRLASMEPVGYINYLVAAAVFAVGHAKQDAICRSFGIAKEMRKYQDVSNVFDKGVREFSYAMRALQLIPQPYPSIMVYVFFVLTSLYSQILFVLLWGATSLIRRAMRRQKVDIKTWDEGWLLKIMLTLYLPLMLITILVNSFVSYELSSNIFSSTEVSDPVGIIIFAVQLLSIIVLILKLRKRYSISLGERVSLLRFIFRIPMETRAWICRSYALLFGAQIIFLLCFGMLASQIFISHYGANPWQIARIPLYNQDVEKATAQRLADEMRKFAIEKGIIRSDNSAIGHASVR